MDFRADRHPSLLQPYFCGRIPVVRRSIKHRRLFVFAIGGERSTHCDWASANLNLRSAWTIFLKNFRCQPPLRILRRVQTTSARALQSLCETAGGNPNYLQIPNTCGRPHAHSQTFLNDDAAPTKRRSNDGLQAFLRLLLPDPIVIIPLRLSPSSQ